MEQIQFFNKLAYGVHFFRGAAGLFPQGSLPERLLGSLAPFAYGMEQLGELALTREREVWQTYHGVHAVRQTIERYGRRRFVVNETSAAATEVWQIGEHLVLWQRNWEGAFASKSAFEDIAAEAFRCVAADIGDGCRIAITNKGFEADTEVAPKRMIDAIARLCDQLRVELAHRHRTVLLYGPAGSGKTAAARQLVEALADSCVVITSETLAGDRANNDPFNLVCTWRPSAVVIDDVDRVAEAYPGDAWFISGITRVRAVVPLVIATANSREVFSGAALRPGRFDRVLEMDRMDETIARGFLRDAPGSIQERAIEAGMLGAYLDELAFRIETGDDPGAALEELLRRQAQAGDGYTPIGEVEQRKAKATGLEESQRC